MKLDERIRAVAKRQTLKGRSKRVKQLRRQMAELERQFKVSLEKGEGNGNA